MEFDFTKSEIDNKNFLLVRLSIPVDVFMQKRTYLELKTITDILVRTSMDYFKNLCFLNWKVA